MLFSSQRDRTANGSIHQNAGSPMLLVPRRQISGHLPASGSVEDQTDSDTFFVVSPSLDALCSTFFYWSSLFPLERLGGLGYWSSHW